LFVVLASDLGELNSALNLFDIARRKHKRVALHDPAEQNFVGRST
jgi:hypothetical protein